MLKKRLTTSDDESEYDVDRTELPVKTRKKRNNKNILLKFLNRSYTGFFSINKKCNNHSFQHIPVELRFCLKDMIPFCYLANHVFMGLTHCGNFLISYKRVCCENENYDFNSGYRYELFFWVFKPHMPLQRYYKINLFDDHGIEDIKYVYMTQWKNVPQTLIIHGSSEIEDQHSYVSIVRVPKLGCLNCKKLREHEASDNLFKHFDLCIQCNLTVHTKYRFNESTQKFQPKIHLNAPKYVIMCENSLIHTINVKLDMQKMKNFGKNFISQKYLLNNINNTNASCDEKNIEIGQDNNNVVKIIEPSSSHTKITTKPISIVEQILADFSEIEETAMAVEAMQTGCEEKNTLNSEQPKSLKKTDNLIGQSSNRFITKKSNAPSSPEMLEAAAKTYEFSEENEKCEKISIFRKRRLADKKYEFSEENTENIIPFNRIRSKISKRTMTTIRKPSPHPHFRSPCNSPINNRHLMSPPPGFMSPSYYCTYRSSPTYHFLYSPPPRHLAQRIGNMSPASHSEDIHKYFSDIMNRMKDNRIESGNESHDELKINNTANNDTPIFSKKIVNYYVEEDDANSVVTCEEDDCISPGYHCCLQMEVHGSCYSKMQIISKSSLSRLKRLPRSIITQNSFDIETFSIHIANSLCKKNDKKYGILFDLAFEIIQVCPLSHSMICALCLQFTASDFDRLSQCLNCSNESDCFLHRRLYETTVLFLWKMTNDEWKILDYGNLKQLSAQMKLSHPIRGNHQELLIKKLQRYVKKIFGKDKSFLDKYDHLKILDCNEDKSKDSLTDYKNGIEFYRRQPYDSPSSISSLSSNSSASGSSDSDSCDESLQ